MASHAPSTDAIRDRAALWVARVNDNDLSDAERDDLQAWLLADPRHASEFRAHNALLALARELPADLRSGLEAFVPAAVVEPQLPPRRRRWWGASLAAAILLAIGAVGWFQLQPLGEKQVYATRTGQNLTITLEDGSVAHLNTRTRVQWIGGTNERRVRLLGAGEAFFDVIHDPLRPFIVELEDSEIVVLGTQFNVYRKLNGEVTVTVTEGKVGIRESVRHGSGQRREVAATSSVVYRVPGPIQEAPVTVVASATKWREGLLVIYGQLPDMISELRRYTDKPIVIADERLKTFSAGGSFSVRNVRDTLDKLAFAGPLKVTETEDAFTLTYRNE